MAQHGRLSIVEYLMTLPEQQVDGYVYWSLYHCLRGMNATGPINSAAAVVAEDRDINVKENDKRVLALLLEQRTEPHGRKVENEAVGNGDIETLRLIHETQGLVYLDSNHTDNLAAIGDLATLQFLLDDCSMTCTRAAMDGAASAGHLAVVQYLNETRLEGCTTAAMDGAAANGHLEIVQFLHTNRTEGCTTAAMDDAAYNGHYEIVTFLHENRIEGCTTSTMDCLAGRGHVALVMRLHKERTEGCSSAAMVYASPFINTFAVANGRDTRKVLFFLLENRKERHGKQLEVDAAAHGDLDLLKLIHRTRGLRFLRRYNVDQVAAKGYLAVLKMALTQGKAICTPAAMDGAAVNGHLEVVQYLHEKPSIQATCTKAAMDGAAVNGHLDVVQYLHEIQAIQTCSITTIHDAAKNGHWQVVAFLHENKYPCYPQIMLNFAARSGKLEFVERFCQGHEMDTKAMESAQNVAKLYHQDQVVAFLEESLQ